MSGYKVINMASKCLEVVDFIKKSSEKPDIIVMDYRMPLKNGIDASKEILQIDPDMKIIMASADLSIREEALSIGIKSFKIKPFSMGKLIRNIEKAIKSEEIEV